MKLGSDLGQGSTRATRKCKIANAWRALRPRVSKIKYNLFIGELGLFSVHCTPSNSLQILRYTQKLQSGTAYGTLYLENPSTYVPRYHSNAANFSSKRRRMIPGFQVIAVQIAGSLHGDSLRRAASISLEIVCRARTSSAGCNVPAAINVIIISVDTGHPSNCSATGEGRSIVCTLWQSVCTNIHTRTPTINSRSRTSIRAHTTLGRA